MNKFWDWLYGVVMVVGILCAGHSLGEHEWDKAMAHTIGVFLMIALLENRRLWRHIDKPK